MSALPVTASMHASICRRRIGAQLLVGLGVVVSFVALLPGHSFAAPLQLAGPPTTTTTTTTTVAPTTTTTAAPGLLLGGLDVNGYCESTTGSSFQLAKGGPVGPNFAYDNWKCAADSGPLTMATLCQHTYGATHPNVIAQPTDPNDANSWQCYQEENFGSGPPVVASKTYVAPIASTIGTPRQIFGSLKHNLLNVAIAIVVMLFITFPAIIFNQTLSENYSEIQLMLKEARRRVRRFFGLKDPALDTDPVPATVATGAGAEVTTVSVRSDPLWFYAILVVGAILGGLLNPNFGTNQQSIEGFAATLVSFAFGAIVAWFVSRAFRRHHRYPTETYLRALPIGLAVAALCVLVSRFSHFQPGYLYGVVASVMFVEALEDRHTAHLIALSTVSTLAVATLAWLAWVPVNHAALQHGHNVFVVFADDVLGSLFIGGLVGTVVGLLPLEFMPGGTLAKWRKDAWAAVFLVSLFMLISVELNPNAGPTHHGSAPLVTAIVLFVIFGGLSFGLRSYFARRKALQLTATSAGKVDAVSATTGPGSDVATTEGMSGPT